MERTIYTITRYDKELNRRFKRDEIKNYIPGSIIGYEDGAELLAQFENLDNAKKAFAEYHSTYGYVGENLEIEEIYLASWVKDEGGDFTSGEILEFAPLDNYSLEQYHGDQLHDLYGSPEHMTVTAENGDYIIGDMYGNNECFDCNDFYQYIVTSDGVYKAYYDDDNVTNVDEIDYLKATHIKLVEKF